MCLHPRLSPDTFGRLSVGQIYEWFESRTKHSLVFPLVGGGLFEHRSQRDRFSEGDHVAVLRYIDSLHPMMVTRNRCVSFYPWFRLVRPEVPTRSWHRPPGCQVCCPSHLSPARCSAGSLDLARGL